jgi:phosphoribosylformimino-5-aminoimidazole carboxamide ribotide isomerase
MKSAGVENFLYTDISRDGTLTEPNYAAVTEMADRVEGELIAAGGISSIDHLLRLAEIGASGAVVGTALYTGGIDLVAAIEALSTKADTC